MPGSYIVQAAYAGFAPFTMPAIKLAADQVLHIKIVMAIETEQQSVTVTDESPMVNVEAGGNANAIVLKGADLDALSDDPDELSNELTALAGPSAGPNGGQIYIDGFTGGTLPPKSAIREIRINQNPFSAEFDHIGYGRIEILTKPGTNTFHGRGFVMGNDKLFNTGNPFVSSIPDYHSIQYNGSISGSFNKKASYSLSVEGRNIQDANIYTASTAVLNTTTGLYFIPTDSNGNIIPVTGSVFSPSTRIEVSPRIDLQLGAKDTLTLRYQYERGSQSGSLSGATSLPTLATSGTSSEHAIQLTDSHIINDHISFFHDAGKFDANGKCIGKLFRRRLRRAIQYRPYRSSGIAEHDHHVSRRPCHQVWGMAARQSRRQLDEREFQRQLQLPLAASLCGYAERSGTGANLRSDSGCLPGIANRRVPAQQFDLHHG